MMLTRLLVIGTLVVSWDIVDAQQAGEKGVRVTEGKPPDRDHDGNLSDDEFSCPPWVNGMKATPDPSLGDKEVSDPVKSPDSNNLVDYFMGEWKFVLESKDLIVQKWCINRPPAGNKLRDHFTYRILTSENGSNTERIKADDEET
jgi:hypothetical protein